MATDAKKMDFAAELAIGKPNSLGNTLSVVKAVESNPNLFSQLLKLLLHEDSIVAKKSLYLQINWGLDLINFKLIRN